MNKAIRILDANVNRSREGLRVVEDIVRFVLDDAELASNIKNMRHEITSLIRQLPLDEAEFLNARDSGGDVGMSLDCASEGLRLDLSHIATANICRAQEAMRVLEEFSKLYSVEVSASFKKLRFRLYDLEKEILPKIRDNQAQPE